MAITNPFIFHLLSSSVFFGLHVIWIPFRLHPGLSHFGAFTNFRSFSLSISSPILSLLISSLHVYFKFLSRDLRFTLGGAGAGIGQSYFDMSMSLLSGRIFYEFHDCQSFSGPLLLAILIDWVGFFLSLEIFGLSAYVSFFCVSFFFEFSFADIIFYNSLKF